MWSRKAAAAIVALVLLGGCGFRPLYGVAPGQTKTVRGELAQISVKGIDGRTGQQLRNQLVDLLNPRGEPQNPAYSLNVFITISEELIGMDIAALSTRTNLKLDATYTLTSSPGASGQILEDSKEGHEDKVLMKDQQMITSGYNIYSSEFATQQAERDAKRRVIREMGKVIQTQLAAYFAKSQRPAGKIEAGP